MRALLVGVFGVAGVLSRYFIDEWTIKFTTAIPYGTLGINLLGSFLAGLVYVVGMERGQIPVDLRTAIMVGFLGGFTTFSAYCLQSAKLWEAGSIAPSLLYLLISPALGLLAAFAGISLARSLF